MTGARPSDQTARTRCAEVTNRQVVAPVLVDAEQAGVFLVAAALEVLVEVATDRDGPHLHEGVVIAVVHAHAPRRVLSELDARRAFRVHRTQRPMTRRLGRRLPQADDLRRLAVECDAEA